MKRTAILFALVGTAMCLSGCDWLQPTVTSPFSGKPVTEGQLVVEINRAESDARAKAESAADKAAAAVRAAKATVARAGVEAELTLAESSALTSAASEALNRQLAEIRQGGDDAAAAIEAKRSQFLGGVGALTKVPMIGQALGGFGIDGTTIAALIGGGGMLYQNRAGRKQRQEVRDKTTAQIRAEEAEKRAIVDKEWEAAKNDHAQQLAMLMAVLHPAPAKPVVGAPA